MDQLNNLNSFFWYCYFWLIFILVNCLLLKPDFNCCNIFALLWVDKVTTDKVTSFASVIVIFVAWFATAPNNVTQSAEQVRIKLISQLVKENSSFF